jgi:hypothetical protein
VLAEECGLADSSLPVELVAWRLRCRRFAAADRFDDFFGFLAAGAGLDVESEAGGCCRRGGLAAGVVLVLRR